MSQASGEETTAGRIKSLKDDYGVVLDSIFPLPLVHEFGLRPQGRRQVRAWLRDKRTPIPLSRVSVGAPGQERRLQLIRCLHRDKIRRVRELVDRSLPTFAIPGQRVPFLMLLRGRGVYDTRDGGLSLASFRSVSKISLPATTAGSHRVETSVTGETRQHLENGMERMLRSRQDISDMKKRLGIIPYIDKTLPSSRRHYLQLVRALLTWSLSFRWMRCVSMLVFSCWKSQGKIRNN